MNLIYATKGVVSMKIPLIYDRPSQERMIHFTPLQLIHSSSSLSCITNYSLPIGLLYAEIGGSRFVRNGSTFLPNLTD